MNRRLDWDIVEQNCGQEKIKQIQTKSRDCPVIKGLEKCKNCTKGVSEAENKNGVVVHLKSLWKLQLMAELSYKYTEKNI